MRTRVLGSGENFPGKIRRERGSVSYRRADGIVRFDIEGAVFGLVGEEAEGSLVNEGGVADEARFLVG
jgi:hypothetical protein